MLWADVSSTERCLTLKGHSLREEGRHKPLTPRRLKMMATPVIEPRVTMTETPQPAPTAAAARRIVRESGAVVTDSDMGAASSAVSSTADTVPPNTPPPAAAAAAATKTISISTRDAANAVLTSSNAANTFQAAAASAGMAKKINAAIAVTTTETMSKKHPAAPTTLLNLRKRHRGASHTAGVGSGIGSRPVSRSTAAQRTLLEYYARA